MPHSPSFAGKKTFLGVAPVAFLGAAMALASLPTSGMSLGLFLLQWLLGGSRERPPSWEGQGCGVGAQVLTQTPSTHCRPWVPIPAPECSSHIWAVLGDISGRNSNKLILKGVQRGPCTPSTAPPRSFSSGTACSYYNKHLSRNLALICILAALILMKYANVCKMKFIS